MSDHILVIIICLLYTLKTEADDILNYSLFFSEKEKNICLNDALRVNFISLN